MFLGIFWKRFGTPTKEASSGTEHEFLRAYAAWQQHGRPQIMVYFNQRAAMPKTRAETDQWGQVLDFQQRFPSALEAAAYFVATEGLTNAVKHAQASSVAVSAAREDGSLVITITDDGVGGAAAAPGSGLAGLADRVQAQGGTLKLDSAPGMGTRLTVELPCAS